MSLRGARLGTGSGRPTKGAAKVAEVESRPCPSRPGPHWLRNDARGLTYCVGCRRSWAELDAEIRQAHRNKQPGSPGMADHDGGAIA